MAGAAPRVEGRVIYTADADAAAPETVAPYPAVSASASQEGAVQQLPPGVDAVIIDGSTRYEVVDGIAYRINGGRRVKVDELYDPGYLDANYVQRRREIFRVAPDGRQYIVNVARSENFDGLSDVRELIGPERGWTGMTLQSPRAPTARAYNDLAGDIIEGGAFVDNELSLVNAGPRGKVLRTSAVIPSGRTVVSKASLDTGLVYFEPGDTFIFSGSFRIEGAMPVTIMDLESSYISEGPGLRLLLEPDGRPRMELKWGTKPVILSRPGTKISKGQWHDITIECELDVIDGRCIMDLDGQRVIDGRGPTFPVRGQAYDRLQVGVTARDGRSGSEPSIVYVDAIEISRR